MSDHWNRHRSFATAVVLIMAAASLLLLPMIATPSDSVAVARDPSPAVSVPVRKPNQSQAAQHVELTPTPITSDDDDAQPMQSVSAIITDDTGEPAIDSAEYPLGELVALSARKSTHGDKPRSVLWIVSPPERAARAKVSFDGLDICISSGTTPVEITVTLICALGDEAAVQSVKLLCGKGPRPPPDPAPDPNPKPTPQPKAEKLTIAVVEDVLSRSPDAARILNATATWQSFRDSGHDTWFYDLASKEPMARWIVREIDTKKVPVLVIIDQKNSTILETMPLPKSVNELTSAVKKWGNVK